MEPPRLRLHVRLTSKGNPILGAVIFNPRTSITTHTDVKSQPERRTLNREDLAAITVALRQENVEDHLNIITDSSFCINRIRNYTIDPASYIHHINKDILHHTDQHLRARDAKQLRTHIGKVKSHTDIECNESADTAARAVVDGEAPPGIPFDDADPPIGGLRTSP